MTPDEFWEFCTENRKLRAELTIKGDVVIMPPTGFETGVRNSEINLQLRAWSKTDGTGLATDSNAGFILPNGAIYSPDAAWTSNERLSKFSAEELKRFLPSAPDFVIELRSESDDLSDLKAKMNEYVENGVRLGWLIDPRTKTVHIYRPGRESESRENAGLISGEDVLNGFELDLTEIW
jgi:Uma2 family endonuclease